MHMWVLGAARRASCLRAGRYPGWGDWSFVLHSKTMTMRTVAIMAIMMAPLASHSILLEPLVVVGNACTTCACWASTGCGHRDGAMLSSPPRAGSARIDRICGKIAAARKKTERYRMFRSRGFSLAKTVAVSAGRKLRPSATRMPSW
jgi:hypothetical protein